jgi:hypothetical protein
MRVRKGIASRCLSGGGLRWNAAGRASEFRDESTRRCGITPGVEEPLEPTVGLIGFVLGAPTLWPYKKFEPARGIRDHRNHSQPYRNNVFRKESPIDQHDNPRLQ